MNEWIQPGLLITIIGGLVRMIWLLSKISESMVGMKAIQIQHGDDIDDLQVRANDLDGDVRVIDARLTSAGINGRR